MPSDYHSWETAHPTAYGELDWININVYRETFTDTVVRLSSYPNISVIFRLVKLLSSRLLEASNSLLLLFPLLWLYPQNLLFSLCPQNIHTFSIFKLSNLEIQLYNFFFFLFLKIFIYLFGCTRSQLQQVGSLVAAPGLLSCSSSAPFLQAP